MVTWDFGRGGNDTLVGEAAYWQVPKMSGWIAKIGEN